MQKIMWNDECTIQCGGPYAVRDLIETILDLTEEGYILDPTGRQSHCPKMISAGLYQAVMVKSPDSVELELKGKSPEELVAIIKENNGKKRLLEIAGYLDIDIPSDKKHPTAISKFLCDSVMEVK